MQSQMLHQCGSGVAAAAVGRARQSVGSSPGVAASRSPAQSISRVSVVDRLLVKRSVVPLKQGGASDIEVDETAMCSVSEWDALMYLLLEYSEGHSCCFVRYLCVTSIHDRQDDNYDQNQSIILQQYHIP